MIDNFLISVYQSPLFFIFISGRIEYATALFKPETVIRWSQQYVLLLEQLCSSADGHIRDLSMMGEQECGIVRDFSMGEERLNYLEAPLFHEAFVATAKASPSRRCLFYEGQWMTYGELDRQSLALAKQLAGLGIGRGALVGLMLDRSSALVVSMLAVLRAGGAYLPCDPSYPDDRLEIYLEDGGATLVLTQAAHAARARSMVGRTVRVLDVEEALAGQYENSSNGRGELKRPSPEDPAYVIFTSGSTGRPKGVAVPHRGLRDLVPWLCDLFGLGKEYRAREALNLNRELFLIKIMSLSSITMHGSMSMTSIVSPSMQAPRIPSSLATPSTSTRTSSRRCPR